MRTADQEPNPGVLQAYLDKHAISQEAFSQKFAPEISQGLVWQWLQWLKNPAKGTRITAERAKEIESLTDGEVRACDLRPDLFEAKAA